MEAQPNNTCS